jgi:ACS family hexuronate transporter-like MFS transporter
MILEDSRAHDNAGGERRLRWSDLLKLPQTWGTIVARTFTDPVWFFITDWFPIYLVAKGITLQNGLIAIWIPFIAADLGNFFGGVSSGYLVRNGWSLGAARKALVVFGGIGVTLLIPTIFTVNLGLITLLFAIATFCYAAFSTIANVLPSDLFNSSSVAGHALVRCDHRHGRTGAVRGNDSGPAAGSQHPCNRDGIGASHVIRRFS